MTDRLPPGPYDQLRHYRAVMQKAEANLLDVLKLLFPIGSLIRWKIGRYTHTGKVEQLLSGDRIKVHNIKTKRDHWITTYDILAANGGVRAGS